MQDSVSGSSVTFKTGFKGMGAKASMTVDTFVFDQVGTVGTPSERWTVARGDMKFNIELNNWEWCGADSECKGTASKVHIKKSLPLFKRAPKKS